MTSAGQSLDILQASYLRDTDGVSRPFYSDSGHRDSVEKDAEKEGLVWPEIILLAFRAQFPI